MSGVDRWIRLTTTGCVALLALIAATVSYLHMHMLVELHGQPGWVAALTPFSVDGMIVAASMALLAVAAGSCVGAAGSPGRPIRVISRGVVQISGEMSTGHRDWPECAEQAAPRSTVTPRTSARSLGGYPVRPVSALARWPPASDRVVSKRRAGVPKPWSRAGPSRPGPWA